MYKDIDITKYPRNSNIQNGYRHPGNMPIKTKKWDLAIEIRKKQYSLQWRSREICIH